MKHLDHQQPISWGEIADVQRRVDVELLRELKAEDLMAKIWSDDLFQDMTPTERDVALGYLDSIRQDDDVAGSCGWPGETKTMKVPFQVAQSVEQKSQADLEAEREKVRVLRDALEGLSSAYAALPGAIVDSPSSKHAHAKAALAATAPENQPQPQN